MLLLQTFLPNSMSSFGSGTVAVGGSPSTLENLLADIRRKLLCSFQALRCVQFCHVAWLLFQDIEGRTRVGCHFSKCILEDWSPYLYLNTISR